jgi:hypothetical protein
MKTLITGIALAVLLSAAPAIAKDTRAKAMGDDTAAHSATLDENANRHRNDDGTFQGKPVVQGPAHWSSAASGASSGESGSDTHNSAKYAK